MALTRKMLSAMGIEQDKIDQIIESHTETVDGLKKQAEEYKEKASKADSLQKKLDEIEAKEPDTLKDDYEKLKAEFDGYKETVAAENAKREKAELFKALLKEAGIDEKRLSTIVKVTDLSKIEVEDGKIKDADTVKKEAAEEWKDFIVKTSTEGAQVDTPPEGEDPKAGTNPSTVKRLKERHERLYGKTEGE